MRPTLVLAGVLLAATVAMAGGCSPKKVVAPQTPPTTRLFVQFDADDGGPHTVYHIVRLFWYGSDVDGFVVGYQFRFLFPSGPADPPWTFTTKSDSTFVIPDTTGLVAPTFEVRAVDDGGLVDPSPARQEFSFSNDAPTVSFINPPRVTADTTFASQTVSWQGIDPDGDAGLLRYRVWLDDRSSQAVEITANSYTFPTADFLKPDGVVRAGPHTANVQAIDPGGRTSSVAQATWIVRPTVADSNNTTALRVLLVDDLPDGPVNNSYNNFWVNAVRQAGVANGSFTLLNLPNLSSSTWRAFRSSEDMLQSFALFDAVVWYRGNTRFFSGASDTMLARHSDAVGRYLDSGGSFLLESLDMVSAPGNSGLLDQAFMKRYLGSDGVRRNLPFGGQDSTAEWSIAQAYIDTVGTTPVTRFAILRSTAFNDSLRMIQQLAGLRSFVVRDTFDVGIWARDSVLSPRQAYSAAIAVRQQHAFGGRSFWTSVPIAPANGYASSLRFLTKVFAFLGVQPSASTRTATNTARPAAVAAPPPGWTGAHAATRGRIPAPPGVSAPAARKRVVSSR